MNQDSRRTGLEFAVVLLLLMNGSYLLGRGDASILYLGNLIFHLIGGIVLTVLWLRESIRSLPGLTSQPRLPSLLHFLTPLVAVASGVALMIVGRVGGDGILFGTHLLSAAIATGIVLFSELQRSGQARKRKIRLAFVLSLGFLVAPHILPEPESNIIRNVELAPTSMDGENTLGSAGPFFPSAAEVSGGQVIPESYFFKSDTCGRPGCHTEVVEQWESSAHRFSSFNNQWYRKSIEYMQEVGGTEKAKFCAGCHDPALLFAGNMASPVDSFLTSEAAHTGLACVACHAISEVKNTAGNAGYILSFPRLHELASSENTVVQFVHDRLLVIDPAPHRSTFLKPFMERQPAEFCSSCHKVHMDKAVNDYRWMRGFNTYDNWQASGVSGFGARSFYQPDDPLTCVTCHMPERASEDPGGEPGKIRDHRFLGANTALPVANADSAQLRATIAFLKADRLSVDVFGISVINDSLSSGETAGSALSLRSNTSFATGEERSEFDGPVSSVTARPVIGGVRSGDRVLEDGRRHRIDVVVRSKTIGHFFPTGTIDAQEVWLEVKVTTADGRILLHSGHVKDGRVDSTAHFYRNRLIDAAGNLIDKRNANAARANVYVNLIPPGAADVAHYELDIPSGLEGPILVDAKVQYRKFTAAYNEFAYGGVFDEPFDPEQHSFDMDQRKWRFEEPDSTVSGQLKALPEIPIVTMASAQTALHTYTGDKSAAETGTESVEDTQELLFRWNDYGIALLRNGDLKSAQNAFGQVTRIDPTYADGWINLARAFVREGVTAQAESALAEVSLTDQVYYKAAYLKGVVAKLNGEYEAAIQLFSNVRESFPSDRVVVSDLARTFYLDGQLDRAAELFQEVLLIDSEDLTAHYNLMLVYRGLGELEESQRHQALYERFKADETALALTRAYRSKHPADNNEALPIHSHR